MRITRGGYDLAVKAMYGRVEAIPIAPKYCGGNTDVSIVYCNKI